MTNLNSVFTQLKMRLLPPSSRSFHEKVNWTHAKLDELTSSIDGLICDAEGLAKQNEEMASQFNSLALMLGTHIDEQAEQTRQMLEGAEEHLKLLEEHLNLLERRVESGFRESEQREAMTKRASDLHYVKLENSIYGLTRQPGEDAHAQRARMFANLQPARGKKRVFQLATAKLMSQLDMICSEIGVEYWFAYGTLVAALYCQGSIPWDDDIDICMKRSDIVKLRAFLEEANSGTDDERLGRGYHITEIYDRFVMCRQVRFSSILDDIPVFIDLSIWDEASASDDASTEALRKLRLEMMDEFGRRCEAGGDIAYWNEFPCLPALNSASCAQCVDVDWNAIDSEKARRAIAEIEAVFAKFQARAISEGLILDEKDGGKKAPALAYALDNIYDAPWRRIVWPTDMFLPPVKAKYEKYMFSVPAKAREVCDECYSDSPYLPDDILEHDHFTPFIRDNSEMIEAMRQWVEAAD